MSADTGNGLGPGRNSESLSNNDFERQLYDAYSLLSRFEVVGVAAPRIIVMGEQSAGKSSLMEGIMRIQFNDTGGTGTKTRCPVSYEMRFNPDAKEPVCYFAEDGKDPESPRSINDLQQHIMRKNADLAKGDLFSDRTIFAKIEFDQCQNVTIIDTPGLLEEEEYSVENKHKGKDVRSIIAAKLQEQNAYILCVESPKDWSNLHSISFLKQVDPKLSRTIVVCTKLDTRESALSHSGCEEFVNPEARFQDTELMGKLPFFVSVSPQRCKPGNPDGPSRDEWQKLNQQMEKHDISWVKAALGRDMTPDEQSRIGLSMLVSFLVRVVKEANKEELPNVQGRLQAREIDLQNEIRKLDGDLKPYDNSMWKEEALEKAIDQLCKRMDWILQGIGTIPDKLADHGYTLDAEHRHFEKLHQIKGSFHTAVHSEFFRSAGSSKSAPPRNVHEAADSANGNDQEPSSDASHASGRHIKRRDDKDSRLYGMAQFKRAIDEFGTALDDMDMLDLRTDDLKNRMNTMNSNNDFPDPVTAACTIAIQSMEKCLFPMLKHLGMRVKLIMKDTLRYSSRIVQVENETRPDIDLMKKFLGKAVDAGCIFIDELECAAQSTIEKVLRASIQSITGLGHDLESMDAWLSRSDRTICDLRMEAARNGDLQWQNDYAQEFAHVLFKSARKMFRKVAHTQYTYDLCEHLLVAPVQDKSLRKAIHSTLKENQALEYISTDLDQMVTKLNKTREKKNTELTDVRKLRAQFDAI